MESCPTQAVLPLVGLAAEKVIRERYISSVPRPAEEIISSCRSSDPAKQGCG
ncbi:MAG: hypothetical protein R6U98_11230 [Pirellulaceae bacterium]